MVNGEELRIKIIMIKPIGGLLLVKEKQESERVTAGGLVISYAVSSSGPKQGEVIDKGEGEYNYKGDLIAMDYISVGDVVYYPEHGGTDIEDEEGNKYILLNVKNVLAKKVKGA
jgi:co-chaperonin GroES (HSP10)